MAAAIILCPIMNWQIKKVRDIRNSTLNFRAFSHIIGGTVSAELDGRQGKDG